MWKKVKNGVKKVGKAIAGAVKTVVNAVVEAVTFVASSIVRLIVDGTAALFGIKLTKYIRIRVVVLRDTHGPLVDMGRPVGDDVLGGGGIGVAARPSVAQLNAMLVRARQILEERASVTFKPAMPDITFRGDVAPDAALDPRCPGHDGHWGPFWDHMSGEAGDYLGKIAGGYTIPRVLTVFITRDGTGAGCSIGPFTSYATIDHDEFFDSEDGGRLLAHELAHACNLLHRSDTANLMYEESDRGTNVTGWQRHVIRASSRVTYW